MAAKREAICPTCKRKGDFQYAGEQHWPSEAAFEMGLPAIVRLWGCPSCLTTISEQDLWPLANQRPSSVSAPAQRTLKNSR